MSETTEYAPGEREIVGAVIQLWKENPAYESLGNAKLHALVQQAHPGWSLSEKRLKNVLKAHGLQTNAPLFQYVSETQSHATPDLSFPAGVKLNLTKARGKALYATKDLKAGEKLWSEEALVLVAPVDHVSLMRKSLACAYCARPFQARSSAGGINGVPRGGAECGSCFAQWCNIRCKKKDLIHSAIWHNSVHSKIELNGWIKYENYCIDNQWLAAYGYGVVLISILRDPGKGELKNQMDAMARIRQDIRQKAVDSSSHGLAAEHYEQMWKQGWQLLKEAVGKAYDLSYEEYLYGLGMVNINNLDGSIYLVHSHLNHSCDPNVEVKITGRTSGITVTAKRDIRGGEELLTTYVNPNDELNKRRYDLRINWGFICSCPRCKEEESALKKGDAKVLETLRPRRKSVRFDEHIAEI
jgi:SET domain